MTALPLHAADTSKLMLAVSKYFAAERWDLNGSQVCDTRGDSFHMVLAIDGATVRLRTGGSVVELQPGQAAFVPAASREYAGRRRRLGPCVTTSRILPYPTSIEPLRAAGHADEAIVRLGGDPATSDLARIPEVAFHFGAFYGDLPFQKTTLFL
jgi:hypothetical protein